MYRVVLCGFLLFALVGCHITNQPEQQKATQPAKRTTIIGGRVDYVTNTFKDEGTGKIYSLSDQEVNKETMEAYYPDDEYIKNKPEKVVKLEFKNSTELPEELRDFKPFKVEDGKFYIKNSDTQEWEHQPHCPANNTVLEMSYADHPEVVRRFKFSDMKWSVKE